MTRLLPLAALGLLVTGPPRDGLSAQVATDSGGEAVTAPVAARRLPRGTVLSESDILVARVAARGSTDQVPAAQAGWVTRRVVQRGERLVPPAVAPSPLVSAGQIVQYVFERDGVSLTISGRALTSGGLGDHVAVRLGANRHLPGIITGAGRVSASDSSRSS